MTRVSGRFATTPQRVLVVDGIVAVALLLPVLANALVKGESASPPWLRVLAGGAAIVPLVWRHRAPVAVWAVSGLATLAAMIAHGSPGLLAFGPLVALYTVATTSPRRVSLAAGAVTLVGVTLGVAIARSEALSWDAFVFPVVVVAAAWLIGDNLRVRRAYLAELEASAARTEADRAADAAAAAAQERARIARELHDVVVHHVSVIAVQAGAARMVADQRVDADATQRTWAEVEATARQALGELRQLLGVLRHDEEKPSLSPQPGLDQLDRLVDDVRHAGLPVDISVEGRPVQLPPTVDLSAYRIVQEALTNVLKHEGRVPTTVVVRYGPDDLEIEVADQGPRVPVTPVQTDAGHGLAGMRERVALFGGDLRAGPRPGGGFVVVARIPLAGARS